MDRLTSMRVFVKVVEQGSLAGAARELDLSPAVVTRLVADLEAHLGARLLNRTTRRLALTDVGEDYLGRVRRILADIDEAESAAGASVREPRGEVRIAMPATFASHPFARLLPRLCERHPHLTLDLDVRNATGAEAPDDGADLTVLIVGSHRPLQGEFVARLLARTEVVVCATPEYLDRRGRPAHPRDLVSHDVLLPVLPHMPSQWTFHPSAEGLAREPETVSVAGALSANHVETLYAAALAGMGVVGLPSFMLEDALRHRRLERVLPPWRLLAFDIHACVPSRRYLPARTRAVMDFLVESFGGQARDPWLRAAGCETPAAASPAPAALQKV